MVTHQRKENMYTKKSVMEIEAEKCKGGTSRHLHGFGMSGVSGTVEVK